MGLAWFGVGGTGSMCLGWGALGPCDWLCLGWVHVVGLVWGGGH